MRISLLTQFFPPESLAGANRVAAIADSLADQSTLTVIAPAPSYPDPARYRDQPPVRLPQNGRLVRTSALTAQRRSLPVRAAAEGAMAARLAGLAARSRPDVVVASSPSMFLGPAGLVAARVARARFVWDLRDLTWEYGREGDVLDGAVARTSLNALGRMMWATAKGADLIVCATDGIAAAVRERVRHARVEVVRNGIDSKFLATFDPSHAPAGSGTQVLYAGLLGLAQGLEVLVEVARRAPDLRITIAGDGPRRASLESLAEQHGVANIAFTGYLAPDELVRLYHASDVLFAQLRDSKLHSATAVPSKLLEYMAAARPIVYGGSGAAADLVTTTGSGLVTAAGDAEAIVAAIRRAATAEGREMGRRGRAHVSSLPSRSEEMRRFALLVRGLGQA
jgi:glycosyltransferase involved in cell wall biosynthesis